MKHPTTRPRVVLIGPMGSGKTTVGRLLARRWAVAVRDTDEDIEAVEGRSIGEIFVDDGEARFREIERDAVAKALSDHDGVLSLGGGAVLAEQTRELLAGQPVVFLQVGLADAVSRVGLGESRPLLNQAVGGMRSRIKQLLDERTPIYESVATLTVDTSGRTPEDVAEEIDARIAEASDD
ncbi:shikimate kinase [Nocardioides panacisoli]|uniref:Shikimate kinase n=1 Tax=Nocardioides panacisoli TaxID=627624 RepID=A0ABP7J172_9ACTN